MCPLYMFLKTPPPFPPIILSHLLFGYCQFVLNFSVSGYILLACLFCWLVPTYRPLELKATGEILKAISTFNLLRLWKTMGLVSSQVSHCSFNHPLLFQWGIPTHGNARIHSQDEFSALALGNLGPFQWAQTVFKKEIMPIVDFKFHYEYEFLSISSNLSILPIVKTIQIGIISQSWIDFLPIW